MTKLSDGEHLEGPDKAPETKENGLELIEPMKCGDAFARIDDSRGLAAPGEDLSESPMETLSHTSWARLRLPKGSLRRREMP